MNFDLKQLKINIIAIRIDGQIHGVPLTMNEM